MHEVERQIEALDIHNSLTELQRLQIVRYILSRESSMKEEMKRMEIHIINQESIIKHNQEAFIRYENEIERKDGHLKVIEKLCEGGPADIVLEMIRDKTKQALQHLQPEDKQ